MRAELGIDDGILKICFAGIKILQIHQNQIASVPGQFSVIEHSLSSVTHLFVW
jgi:hypothetical protein